MKAQTSSIMVLTFFVANMFAGALAFSTTMVRAQNGIVVVATLGRYCIYHEEDVFVDSVSGVLNGNLRSRYDIRPQGNVTIEDARIELETPFGPGNFTNIGWDPEGNYTFEFDGVGGDWTHAWNFGTLPPSREAMVSLPTIFQVDFDPGFNCQRIWNPWITSEFVTQTLTIVFTPSTEFSDFHGVHVSVQIPNTTEVAPTIDPDSISASPQIDEKVQNWTTWLDEQDGHLKVNWGGDPVRGTTYHFSVDVTIENELFPEPVFYKPSIGIGANFDAEWFPPETPPKVDHDINRDGVNESWVTYYGTGDFTWQESAQSENSVSLPWVSTHALISCDVSPPETRFGETVTVSGFISPAPEMANVTLTYTKPDLTTVTRTIWTDHYGFYNDTFAPDNAGTWTVYASWPGEIDHNGAASSHASFDMLKALTSVSCSISSEKIQLGENVIITGSMSPTLEDVDVTLTFTKPDNSSLTQTLTLIQGEYTYTLKPDSSGSWYVRASWPGNDNYEGANSSSVDFAVEFLAPVRQILPPENTAVAVAVGASVTVGFTAFMGLSGFAQSFNKAISKLSVPDWLKDFLNLYAEKKFETLTSEEIRALKGKKMLTPRELLSLLFSAIVLLTVFVYVEVNGLPNFWNMEYLSVAVPQVLISVVFVFISTQIFSIVSAKALSAWSEFKLWLYGVAALLITGIIFKIPFASPGKMEYQGDLDRKRAGLIATSEILCILILSIPFYLFYILGFTTMGDAGLMMTLMTACYSSFPFRPLGGEAIFRYNKGLWIAIFIFSFSMFICTILGLLPHVAYLLTGTATTLLFIGLILTLKKQQSYQ